MPHPYRSQILDHLGLVAGMFDELGIGEVIDRATRHHPETRIVTTGYAVKAMVLNGLGFVNQQLYLVQWFFQDKPTSRLLAPLLIEAQHLNDDALGRALDTLYDYGVTELYSLVADLQDGPCDPTSFALSACQRRDYTGAVRCA